MKYSMAALPEAADKSDALLVYTISRCIKYPNTNHLFLRRTYADLEKAGAAFDRALELLSGTNWKYDGQNHKWYCPNGSTFEFGYLQHEDDKYHFQSAQFDTICFDELTHFSLSQFMYLTSRCRSTQDGVPSRIRSACNPGGIGHSWCKARYIDPAPANIPFIISPPSKLGKGNKAHPKELDENSGAAEIAALAELGEQIGERSAIFVPARLQDNSILMKRDPKYWERLMALPENEMRALAFGDWDIFAGQVFNEWRRERHVIQPFNIPKDWPRWIGYDFGLRNPACALWLTRDPDGNVYVYREMYEKYLADIEQAKLIRQMSSGEHIIAMYADPSCFNRQPNGTTIQQNMRRFLPCRMVPANNDRYSGWHRVHEYLRWSTDRPEPRLKVFDECLNLIRTLPAVTYDRHVNRLEDVDTKTEDHAPDALRYLLLGTSVRYHAGGSHEFEVVA